MQSQAIRSQPYPEPWRKHPHIGKKPCSRPSGPGITPERVETLALHASNTEPDSTKQGRTQPTLTLNLALPPMPLGTSRLHRDAPTYGHAFKTGSCFTNLTEKNRERQTRYKKEECVSDEREKFIKGMGNKK